MTLNRDSFLFEELGRTTGAPVETSSNQRPIKGLSYENAETKLHASNLNIQLLLTRYDLPLRPGLIIDQIPQAGEEVVCHYPIGVTITKADSHGAGP